LLGVARTVPLPSRPAECGWLPTCPPDSEQSCAACPDAAETRPDGAPAARKLPEERLPRLQTCNVLRASANACTAMRSVLISVIVMQCRLALCGTISHSVRGTDCGRSYSSSCACSCIPTAPPDGQSRSGGCRRSHPSPPPTARAGGSCDSPAVKAYIAQLRAAIVALPGYSPSVISITCIDITPGGRRLAQPLQSQVLAVFCSEVRYVPPEGGEADARVQRLAGSDTCVSVSMETLHCFPSTNAQGPQPGHVILHATFPSQNLSPRLAGLSAASVPTTASRMPQ
jgi:hypothetical protein